MPKPAPRAAPAPPADCPPCADSLPDAALVQVFASLRRLERHQAAPLVCKRWHQLVHSPLLLGEINFGSSLVPTLPRLRPFTQWLLRWGPGHVRQVHFMLSWLRDASEADEAEAMAMLAACLAACGSSLTHVRLTISWAWNLGSWVLALTRLRSLTADSSAALTVTAPLPNLKALEHLGLTGHPLLLQAPHLPPLLTSLELSSDSLSGLPRQVGSLSRLRQLDLSFLQASAGSFSALAKLAPTLTGLRLSSCRALPRCLSALTSLRSLSLHGTPRRPREEEQQAHDGGRLYPEPVGPLEQALATLTRLTRLTCNTDQVVYERFPASLTALRSLQELRWAGPLPTQELALPAGPWLADLRHAVLPAAVVLASLAALDAATQLTCLGMSGFPSDREPQPGYAILPWAGRHPALHRVVLDYYGYQEVHAPLFEACLHAVRLKPWLHIQRGGFVWVGESCQAFGNPV